MSYWDAYDGQAIRVLEASDTQPINCINIDVQGEAIVSGSTDKLVKVWVWAKPKLLHPNHPYLLVHSALLEANIIGNSRNMCMFVRCDQL